MGIVADVALLRKGGKDVIRVRVKKSTFPVCYRGEYHYRSGAVKMLLTGTALTEFLLSKSGMDWDAAPTSSGFVKDEHSFTALAARYRKERKSKLTDADFESFGLALADGRLTNAGALFADDCPLRHSRVFCTRWNGCDMAAGVVDAKDDQEYSGGILSMLQYAEDFVRVNSRRAWHKLARTRVEFVIYGFNDEQLATSACSVPPVATPVAPPVAPPVATPVATPVTTPVVTPVATPVAKPSESLIDEVQRKVLTVLRDGILSTAELAAKVGISQPKNLRRRYLRLLLDMGLVEYTIPQKPNSRLQKYRLTEKGHAWEYGSFRASAH